MLRGLRIWTDRCVSPGMDKDQEVREKECCARCRWVEVTARPYGAVEYVCKRRQELIASSLIAKRRCSEFKP